MHPNERIDPIVHIERLMQAHGQQHYDGARAESVTALQHALQCAQLAEWADAAPPLVAAALLHDIGHFIDPEGVDDATDDVHELRALPFLMLHFGEAVALPVRWHVAAKRHLVASDPRYLATLSPASVHSLALQGGPMSDAERAAFDALPGAADALRLRRWDDLAKTPGKRTPPLAYYLALLDDLKREHDAGPRTDIGAFDVA